MKTQSIVCIAIALLCTLECLHKDAEAWIYQEKVMHFNDGESDHEAATDFHLRFRLPSQEDTVAKATVTYKNEKGELVTVEGTANEPDPVSGGGGETYQDVEIVWQFEPPIPRGTAISILVTSVSDDTNLKLPPTEIHWTYADGSNGPSYLGMTRYEPDVWNEFLRQRSNNCYNYACNKITFKFAQPGAREYGPLQEEDEKNCAEYTKRALSDGLKSHDGEKCEEKSCPDGHHKVVLLVRRGVDYHWYRQDIDGTWSHKPAQDEATNKSRIPGDDNDTIDNLDEVKKDAKIPWKEGPGYDEFCGCFCCPSNPDDVYIAGVSPPEVAPGTVCVCLDLFSGRPNPWWQIPDPCDIETLKGFLQDLPVVAAPDWPHLGYRGITIENQSIVDFPPLVTVFEGVIRVYGQTGVAYYEDAGGMEAWLCERMPDWDGDGLPSPLEALLFIDPTNPDTDGDLVSDGPLDPDGEGPILAGPDNCPAQYNPDQTDTDGDGVGDACAPMVHHLTVDDFEGYTYESPNRVSETWRDGLDVFWPEPILGNGSGAVVSLAGGGGDAPIETDFVHGGNQAMCLSYNNYFWENSFTERTFDPVWDWSPYDALSLWVRGEATNTGGQFFVRVNDRPVYPELDVVNIAWTETKIPLDSFGPDLLNVASLSIGVDGADVGGMIYVDDIVLLVNR